MAARSIASLSLSFGLVSIPVKVYTATESKAGVSFNLLHKGCGSRLKQQYICLREDVVVERSEMVKGYEFEKDHYVVFEPEELDALEAESRHTIDIVSFVPAGAIDPIYFDNAYYLGPDKRGAKPYALLAEAMRQTGTCALARWVWKGKQYMVQVRAGEEGLILQQLLYADEVRPMADLHVEQSEVHGAELSLALQLIEQNTAASYDPAAYADEEKARVLAAIDKKIAGKKITVTEQRESSQGAEVIDLMEALRASIQQRKRAAGKAAAAPDAPDAPKARKTARRATAAAPAPAMARRAAGKK
ncbi:DNA end-binding protein Ku [Cupriavidus basilensis OR16]|uniref:Non-homologous end joining protein Ku n=1 Tax=Cupriavidus basilensis OR16 TaxID=1127483 RepID=H1S3Q4_9BURK|nr:Ku protein [Cupriavidus basilensis]EHP42828.1 DNA end-binding protein Ku [Cupriavidus basilensis OR16]